MQRIASVPLICLAAALAALAACAPAPTARARPVWPWPTVAPEAVLTRKEIFLRLARTPWCARQGEGWHAVRTYYRFHSDGTYEWGRYTDIPEDGGAGRWNFIQTRPGGGILLLDAGDMLPFSVHNDGSLSVNFQHLSPCGSQPDTTTAGSAEALPPVRPSPLFTLLTANTWQQIASRIPQTPSYFEFHADGTYVARFPDACTSRGEWSLRGNIVTTLAAGEDCDSRTAYGDVYPLPTEVREADAGAVFLFAYGKYAPAAQAP